MRIPPAQDRRLLRILDDGFREVADRAGGALACARGCDACCRDPFPVTALDRGRLARAWEELARTDPPRATKIALRARQVRARFREGYPGDPEGGALVSDVDRLDRFFERHRGTPCPVLDPATGSCELYDSRPVACRLHGPPLRFAGRDAPPCHLCFRDASAEEIEACRWEPDPEGFERALLDEMGISPDAEWEAPIAWAIPDPGAGDV